MAPTRVRLFFDNPSTLCLALIVNQKNQSAAGPLMYPIDSLRREWDFSLFFHLDLLCLSSSRSKYHASTVSYLLLFFFTSVLKKTSIMVIILCKSQLQKSLTKEFDSCMSSVLLIFVEGFLHTLYLQGVRCMGSADYAWLDCVCCMYHSYICLSATQLTTSLHNLWDPIFDAWRNTYPMQVVVWVL